MKKIYALIVAVICVTAAGAQTANAVVFSEMGEKFTLYLNGEQQNANPMANVKVSGLTGEFYQARIDFEDAALADFIENNFAVAKNVEVTYKIKLNKKGGYKLAFGGQTELGAGTASATPAPATSETKNYAVVDDNTEETVTTTSGGSVDGDVTVVETTTTTTGTPSKTGEKVSMDVNFGGMTMGVNVNVQGDGMGMETEENTSVTTTTQTTTSTAGTATAVTTQPREDVVVTTATSGCSKSMTDAAFTSAKKNIADKGFDETRLSTAKSIIKSNCMTAAQIKEICDTFGFEETKLDFAKFAHDYCFDQNNYFMVNETFSFSSSTEELNNYIDSK